MTGKPFKVQKIKDYVKKNCKVHCKYSIEVTCKIIFCRANYKQIYNSVYNSGGW